MPRPIHFEISADQPERAVKFYSTVFGWKINNWEGGGDYWLITTGEAPEPGIDGAIQKRTSPEMSTVNTISVLSLDEALEKISAGGGKILSEKMEIPGVGTWSMCLDTEGNHFGVLQAAPGT